MWYIHWWQDRSAAIKWGKSQQLNQTCILIHFSQYSTTWRSDQQLERKQSSAHNPLSSKIAISSGQSWCTHLGSLEANVSGHEFQSHIWGIQACCFANVTDEVTHGFVNFAVNVQVHLVDARDVGEAPLHVVFHLDQEQRPCNWGITHMMSNVLPHSQCVSVYVHYQDTPFTLPNPNPNATCLDPTPSSLSHINHYNSMKTVQTFPKPQEFTPVSRLRKTSTTLVHAVEKGTTPAVTETTPWSTMLMSFYFSPGRKDYQQKEKEKQRKKETTLNCNISWPCTSCSSSTDSLLPLYRCLQLSQCVKWPVSTVNFPTCLYILVRCAVKRNNCLVSSNNSSSSSSFIKAQNSWSTSHLATGPPHWP